MLYGEGHKQCVNLQVLPAARAATAAFAGILEQAFLLVALAMTAVTLQGYRFQ